MIKIFSFLKKLISTVLTITIILAALLYYTLTAEWIWEKYLPPYLNSKLTGTKIEEVNIGQVHLAWPTLFNLQGIATEAEWLGKSFLIMIREIQLGDDSKFVGLEKNFRTQIDGIVLDQKNIHIGDSRIDLNFKSDFTGAKEVEGVVLLGPSDLFSIPVENLKSRIEVNDHRLKLPNITGHFMNGDLIGSFEYGFDRPASYYIDLAASDIDLKAVQGKGGMFYEDQSSLASFIVKIQGTKSNFSTFRVFFDAPQGGFLKSSLLRMLLEQIIPQGRPEADIIKQSFSGSEYVRLDEFYLQVEQKSLKTLEAVLRAKSQEANLDIDLTIDIPTPDGAHSFFQSLTRVALENDYE